MMKKRLVSILSLVLVLCMLASMPLSAFATDAGESEGEKTETGDTTATTEATIAEPKQTSTTAVTGTVADGMQSYTDNKGKKGALLTEKTVTVSEQWEYNGVTYGKISDDCWIDMGDKNFTKTSSGSSSSSSSSAVGQTGVINHTNNVNVRNKGSITGGSIIGTIAPGTEITVYAERTDSNGNLWYKISDTEDKWVISTYVTLGSSSSTTGSTTTSTSTITASKTGVINHTSSVNVRNAGSIVSGTVIGSIATGTEVGIYDERTDSRGNLWYKISDTEDKWVISTYVKITDGSSSTSGTSSTTSSTTTTNGTIANCSTGANYRSAASISGTLLGRLAVGSRVTITKVATASNGVEWGYADGYGWICMTYVTLDSTSSVDEDTGKVTSTVTSTTGAAYANITVTGKTTDSTPVYLNADTSSTKLITLGSGQTVSITGRALVDDEQWGKVTISGNTGWLKMSTIKLDKLTGTVSAAQLSVYEGMSTDSDVYVIWGKGQTMSIYTTKTDGTYLWGRVTKDGNTERWVNMSGVAITTSSSDSTSTSSSISITAKVKSDDTKVFDEDNKSTVIVELVKDTKITITDLDNYGYGKTTVGSYTGWINMDAVTQDSITGTVSADSAALYTANNTSSKSSKSLAKGTSVTILEQSKDSDGTLWGKLIYNGAYYYIKMSQVSTGSSSSSSTTSSSSSSTTSGTTTSTTTGTAGTVVNTDSLNVRSAAGVSNTLVTTLSRGTAVTVYEQTTVDNALWGRIDQGWVAMSYIDLSSNSTTTTASSTSSATTIITTVPSGAVAVGYVNYVNTLTIRAGAGLGYDAVGTLNKGANVVIYEQKLTGGMIWGRIDQGWICTSYVTLTGLSVTGSGSAGTVARCFFTANIRSSAGVGNALVGKVMVNSRLEILSTTTYSGETWGLTSIGWINMEYVLLDSETA